MSSRLIAPARSRYVAQIVVLSGVYFASAKLGLKLASAHPSITAVWPPTGIALTALVVWGFRLWPGVALGAALANAFTADTPAVAVAGITLGNTLEAVLGAYLLVNVARFVPSLERVRDVLALVVFAAGLSTMVSATIGVTSLWIGGQIDAAGDLPSAWRVWWLGDMGGDLLVAPFLLVLASGARPPRVRARIVEACALLCVLIGLALLVFSRSSPLPYLIFPPLIWAALRFRQLGATVSSLIVATIAVIFVEQDLGPFARGSADDSLLLAQTFTSVAGATALLLAAITSERARAEEELQIAHDRLEEKVEERTAEVELSHKELELQGLIARNMVEGVCLIRVADSVIVHANPEFERMFGYDSGELDGRSVADLEYRHGPTAAVEAADGMTRNPERRGEAGYDVLNRKKDGTPFWSHSHTTSFDHPEHGAVWVAVHEDITERKRAEILERSFVPERLPDIPGLQLAARFIPGGAGVEVGGDWYDVVEMGDGTIAVVIGDVAGRGVQAAAVMGQLRNALRAYLFESHPPAVALQLLNGFARSLDQNVMATVAYLVLDPSSGRVRLANAGHLPPLQVGPDGSTRFLDQGRSLPLGVRPATPYEEVEYVVGSGSTLLLYTDGLVETRDAAIDEGLGRLARAAAVRHDGVEGLCDRLLAELSPTGEDDVALLALQPIRLPERLELTMPADPGVIGSFRRTIGVWLGQRGVGDEDNREIVVACNEAFANSIEHAYGPAGGKVEVGAAVSDGRLSITIRDFGGWRDPRGEHRGRGLTLMEAFMDSVTVFKTPREGTEIRMVRNLTAPRNGTARRS